MDLKEWAKNEVRIACKGFKEEDHYGRACYESALQAFDSLLGDGHSGCSIQVTKSILNRLIDGKPLTPIEDTPDVWYPDESELYLRGLDAETLQCKRMTSLFKYIHADGVITYRDLDRVRGYNLFGNSNVGWFSKLESSIIDDMFPITMPYIPCEDFKVYVEEFLVDPKHGDWDTVGVKYAERYENGEKKDNIPINRYFREPMENESPTYHGWVEIDHNEYLDREALAFTAFPVKGEEQ